MSKSLDIPEQLSNLIMHYPLKTVAGVEISHLGHHFKGYISPQKSEEWFRSEFPSMTQFIVEGMFGSHLKDFHLKSDIENILKEDRKRALEKIDFLLINTPKEEWIKRHQIYNQFDNEREELHRDLLREELRAIINLQKRQIEQITAMFNDYVMRTNEKIEKLELHLL